MWKQYFKFVKLKPGKVVTSQFGEIDFSADNIGIEIIKSLYENGFPYLEITETGTNELYQLGIFWKLTRLAKESHNERQSQFISN